MEKIRNKAKEFLQNKTIGVVIGFENGTSNNVRPAIITSPENADKLIYDERCKHNLALYISKNEVRKLGRIAIVANLQIMRSIAVLISECQLEEKDLVVFGVSEKGEYLEFAELSDMEKYISKQNLNNPEKDQIILDKLNAMSKEERWIFWQKELSKCIKCYACRSSCPMCYCTRCTTDCNQPQWIPVEPSNNGNTEWHLMRAMHLVGRCVSCGECGRACPLDIPVHLLTMQMSDEAFKMFDVKAGTSLTALSTLSTFKPDDKENFIL